MEHLQSQLSNWSLSQDTQLYDYLDKFTTHLIEKTKKLEVSMKELIHETNVTEIKLNNSVNEFLLISNNQFVENRVYEDDDIVPNSVIAKTEEEGEGNIEAETMSRVSNSLMYGLKALDTFIIPDTIKEAENFDKTSILSDGVDIYLKKLPYIIGTSQFLNDNSLGIGLTFDLDNEEDESSEEETDTGSESSEEETSSEEDDSEDNDSDSSENSKSKNKKSVGPPVASTNGPPQSLITGPPPALLAGIKSRRDSTDGSDGEDSDRPVKAATNIKSKKIESDDDNDEKPIKNNKATKKADDWGDDDDEGDAFSSKPVIKSKKNEDSDSEDADKDVKTEAATKHANFLDSLKSQLGKGKEKTRNKSKSVEDDSEWNNAPRKNSDSVSRKSKKKEDKTKEQPEDKEKKGFFGDDEEDDLFSGGGFLKSAATKKPAFTLFGADKSENIFASSVPTKQAPSFLDDSSAKPVIAKQASSLFGDDDDLFKPAAPKSVKKSLFEDDNVPVKPKVETKPIERPVEKKTTATSLFGLGGDDDDDALFSKPKTEIKPTLATAKIAEKSSDSLIAKKNTSLFGDDDDDNNSKKTPGLFGDESSKPVTVVKKSNSLFADDDDELFSSKTAAAKTEIKATVAVKQKSSLFNDDNDDDLFSKPTIKPAEAPKPVISKTTSILPDDDANDIFSKTVVNTNQIPKKVEVKATSSLFGNNDDDDDIFSKPKKVVSPVPEVVKTSSVTIDAPPPPQPKKIQFAPPPKLNPSSSSSTYNIKDEVLSKPSLFGDEDISKPDATKSLKKQSLFDDDDDNDLFNSKPKTKIADDKKNIVSLLREPEEDSIKTLSTSTFDDTMDKEKSTLDRMAKLSGGQRMILPAEVVKTEENENNDKVDSNSDKAVLRDSENSLDIKLADEVKPIAVDVVKPVETLIANDNKSKPNDSTSTKIAKSLFDDDDSSLFSTKDLKNAPNTKSLVTLKTDDITIKSKAITSSLFGDDVDIFASKPKNTLTKSVKSPVNSVIKVDEVNIFSDETKPKAIAKKSLFDDDDDDIFKSKPNLQSKMTTDSAKSDPFLTADGDEVKGKNETVNVVIETKVEEVKEISETASISDRMAKLGGGPRMILPGMHIKVPAKSVESKDEEIVQSILIVEANDVVEPNTFNPSGTVKDLIAQPTINPAGALHQKLTSLNFNPAAMLPGAKPAIKDTPAAALEHATMGRATMKRKGRKPTAFALVFEDAEILNNSSEEAQVVLSSAEVKSEILSSIIPELKSDEVIKSEDPIKVESSLAEKVEPTENPKPKKSLFDTNDEVAVSKSIIKKSLFDDDSDPFIDKVFSKPSATPVQSKSEVKAEIIKDSNQEIKAEVKETKVEPVKKIEPEASKIDSKKKEVKKVSLFDDDTDPFTFVKSPKETVEVKNVEKTEVIPPKESKVESKPEVKTKSSLFDDDDPFGSIPAKPTIKPATKKASLFDDDDDDFLSLTKKKDDKKKTKSSIFDD